MATSRTFVGWLTVLACLLAGCGGSGTADPGPPSPSRTPAASPSGAVIDGTFDVGGHRLYLTCEGSNGPTVLYLHGSITDAQVVPHENASAISTALSQEYRVCRYDRRNVGRSDTVDSVQTPKDALEDLHRLLDAARVEPPYVLLGASFRRDARLPVREHLPRRGRGYGAAGLDVPRRVVAGLPVPPQERYKASDAGDEASLERISHYKVLKAAEGYIGKEPKIPVTYLASISEGYETQGFGEEYDAKIVKLQQAYVDRFSPGTLKRVDAPHFMEPVIPDQIVEELRGVITAAR